MKTKPEIFRRSRFFLLSLLLCIFLVPGPVFSAPIYFSETIADLTSFHYSTTGNLSIRFGEQPSITGSERSWWLTDTEFGVRSEVYLDEIGTSGNGIGNWCVDDPSKQLFAYADVSFTAYGWGTLTLWMDYKYQLFEEPWAQADSYGGADINLFSISLYKNGGWLSWNHDRGWWDGLNNPEYNGTESASAFFSNGEQGILRIHLGASTDGLYWNEMPDPNPIPVPPAILLLGTGLIGVAGIRRRAGRASLSHPEAG